MFSITRFPAFPNLTHLYVRMKIHKNITTGPVSVEFATSSGPAITYNRDFPKLRQLGLECRSVRWGHRVGFIQSRWGVVKEVDPMLVNAFLQEGAVCWSLREYVFKDYPKKCHCAMYDREVSQAVTLW